jgi:hypothetical protein
VHLINNPKLKRRMHQRTKVTESTSDGAMW